MKISYSTFELYIIKNLEF